MNWVISRLLPIVFLSVPVAAVATVVRMQTNVGVIDIQLYDNAAPLTSANFLGYVDSGAYNRSFIHRSVPGFIIQGGGYTWNGQSNNAETIASNPPVVNEFGSDRSNIRGTIAMAKVDGNPDSATNQWFFNLADNSANLDQQNDGFTVFGKVIELGMAVVDRIAALGVANAGGVFSALPLVSRPADSTVHEENLVIISTATSNSANDGNDSDRVFAYLEAAYPEYLSPANALAPANSGSTTYESYYYRYYSESGAYIATSDDVVYYMGPASGNRIIALGALHDWYAQAAAAGY